MVRIGLVVWLAAAAACAQTATSPQRPSPGLAGTASDASAAGLQGTAWQLVKFVGGDDRVLTPDDPAKYTLEFAADGRMAVRLDCNRGRATWKATPAGQLELGPLALTRAACPAGSLHDHVSRQWTYVRSFVIANGRLFLSLMADGGTYELAPAAPADQGAAAGR